MEIFRKKTLLDEAAIAIDTAWHNSWHWETQHGRLTLKGLTKVRDDARRRISENREHLHRLERLMPKVNAQIRLEIAELAPEDE